MLISATNGGNLKIIIFSHKLTTFAFIFLYNLSSCISGTLL